jgi:drug/metabolite transporter (DMT)-like permease
MAIAAFALGEQPTLMIGIGAVVVLISVLALNLERRPTVIAAQPARP